MSSSCMVGPADHYRGQWMQYHWHVFLFNGNKTLTRIWMDVQFGTMA